MGDNDNETLSNVTSATWDFEDEAFDEISDEAKDFISDLLKKDMKWVPSQRQSLHSESTWKNNCCLVLESFWMSDLTDFLRLASCICSPWGTAVRFSSLSEIIYFLFTVSSVYFSQSSFSQSVITTMAHSYSVRVCVCLQSSSELRSVFPAPLAQTGHHQHGGQETFQREDEEIYSEKKVAGQDLNDNHLT